MIDIRIKRADDGAILGFSSAGHADYSEKGSDIICAAVSMLVINTLNSIEALLPEDAEKMVTQVEEGKIVVTFDEEPSEHAMILLEAMCIGLKDVLKEYGDKYINIAEAKGGKRL